MFSKLFSCFNDATHSKEMDLSGNDAAVRIANKPQIPSESKIDLQQVDFEMNDFK
jgi:hypothetical protein